MALFTVRDLCLGYDGREIVHDLNFEMGENDYLCIIGENGSGKTTLMKAILGLVQPMAGEIVFRENALRREIGYLPQQTAVQKDFPAAVREVVLSGCQKKCGLRPYYSKEEKRIAADAMEKMRIMQYAERCYRDLSGGQQQRVLLARAFCAAGEILLLDEPITGLDPKAAAELYALIRALHREGMAVIMISHDLSAALKDATHVLYLGETVFFGTKEAYFAAAPGKKRKEGNGDDNG